MRQLVTSVNQLRTLLDNKNNHYTMIRVTGYVIAHLLPEDFDKIGACGVVLYRVPT